MRCVKLLTERPYITKIKTVAPKLLPTSLNRGRQRSAEEISDKGIEALHANEQGAVTHASLLKAMMIIAAATQGTR
jgi:hypothetical protein